MGYQNFINNGFTLKTVNLCILVLNFFQAVPMLPLVVAKDQTTNEILDGFELDRAQLKLVKLLGTGNFGQVSKAIYGPSQIQVAVKSLKGSVS